MSNRNKFELTSFRVGKSLPTKTHTSEKDMSIFSGFQRDPEKPIKPENMAVDDIQDSYELMLEGYCLALQNGYHITQLSLYANASHEDTNSIRLMCVVEFQRRWTWRQRIARWWNNLLDRFHVKVKS